MPKRPRRAPKKDRVASEFETAATSASGWSEQQKGREQNGSHSAAADRPKVVTELSREVKSMDKAKKEAFSMMGDMSDMNASFQKNAKRIAAWYIDTVENLAKEGLILREKSTSWAKDTPLAAIFEAQNSMAQQLVENSASFARSIFQIDKEEERIKRAVEA